MIDTITYGLTKDLPSGPIVRPYEPVLHGAGEHDEPASMTRGRLIGGILSLGLLTMCGVYLFLAI